MSEDQRRLAEVEEFLEELGLKETPYHEETAEEEAEALWEQAALDRAHVVREEIREEVQELMTFACVEKGLFPEEFLEELDLARQEAAVEAEKIWAEMGPEWEADGLVRPRPKKGLTLL